MKFASGHHNSGASSTIATATPFELVFERISRPRKVASRAHGSHTPSTPTFSRTQAETFVTHGRSRISVRGMTLNGTPARSHHSKMPHSSPLRSIVAISGFPLAFATPSARPGAPLHRYYQLEYLCGTQARRQAA